MADCLKKAFFFPKGGREPNVPGHPLSSFIADYPAHIYSGKPRLNPISSGKRVSAKFAENATFSAVFDGTWPRYFDLKLRKSQEIINSIGEVVRWKLKYPSDL